MQLKLPIETEVFIEKVAPVRLASAIVERMDIRSIACSYSQMGRIEYPPRMLLKILLYAYIQHIYSSREIKRAYQEDIHFMYLLGEYPTPDHNTICRFRSKYLIGHEKELQEQMTAMLAEWGFVSLESVFIDGTKIEANANRYSFVWKKSTEKSRTKLQNKIAAELPNIISSADVKWHIPEEIEIRHLKKPRKKLYEK